VLGYFVSLIQWYYPEKKSRSVSQSLLKKTQEELKWSMAREKSLKLDLKRWEQKNQEWAKEKVQELQEWPKASSYWNFEGPKLKERVLYLEQELAKAQDQLMWRLQ
jgi:hypothetical protein